ncbi:hypothetical protein [Spirosoma aerophilum]
MRFQDLDFNGFFLDDISIFSASSGWFKNDYALRVEYTTVNDVHDGQYLIKGEIRHPVSRRVILGFPRLKDLPPYFEKKGIKCSAEEVTKALLEIEAFPTRERDLEFFARYKLYDGVHSFYVAADNKFYPHKKDWGKRGQLRAICVLEGRYYGEFGYNRKTQNCEWPIYNVALNGRDRHQLTKYFNARLIVRNEKSPPRRMSKYDPPPEPIFYMS